MKQTIIINNKPIKLKKCPFCGNKKVELYTETDSWGRSFATAYVYCNRCTSRGPMIEEDVLSDNTKLKACDGWNERG